IKLKHYARLRWNWQNPYTEAVRVNNCPNSSSINSLRSWRSVRCWPNRLSTSTCSIYSNYLKISICLLDWLVALFQQAATYKQSLDLGCFQKFYFRCSPHPKFHNTAYSYKVN